MTPEDRKTLSFDQALDLVSREDRFKATVYAMNTLLIQKGIYTAAEFEAYFCQWIESRLRKEDSRVSV